MVASKFWYPRGGLERVMFGEIEQLEARGIQVAHFSTDHPQNVYSAWRSYFAPYLELGSSGVLGPSDTALAVARMFWNRTAASLFRRLLSDFQPGLVHVHGIHRQLSPSILFAARQLGVPVVQTLHDAHHVCPADVLLRAGSVVCEPRACGVYNYAPAVINRCVRGSIASSGLSAAETLWQRLLRSYERTVTRFIAPSRHLASVMIDGGWGSIPIDVVPNGVRSSSDLTRHDEGWMLVAGRLSVEKRVDIALEACSRAGVRVVVAGDGPEAPSLKRGFPDVEFVGHLDVEGVTRLLTRCRALLLSSTVPENAPMAVLEAMAAGVPVIAPRLGGVPELVQHGETGLLFEPGSVEDMTECVLRLAGDDDLAIRLGASGSAVARDEFTDGLHAERLLDVYHRAMSTKGPA